MTEHVESSEEPRYIDLFARLIGELQRSLQTRRQACVSRLAQRQDGDPERILLAAYLDCIDRLNILPMNDLRAVQQESSRLLAEMAELEPYIFHRSKAATTGSHQIEAHRREAGDWLTSLGLKYSEADRLLAKVPALKQRAGAPRKARPYVLDAMRQKHSKNLNDYQLATLFCKCGRSQHGQKCAERLRKAMAPLEKLLAKYSRPTDVVVVRK